MSNSYSDSFWTDLRWRIGNQFMLWGLRIMPPGDCKSFLLERIIDWAAASKRQWWLREAAKLTEKAG